MIDQIVAIVSKYAVPALAAIFAALWGMLKVKDIQINRLKGELQSHKDALQLAQVNQTLAGDENAVEMAKKAYQDSLNSGSPPTKG